MLSIDPVGGGRCTERRLVLISAEKGETVNGFLELSSAAGLPACARRDASGDTPERLTRADLTRRTLLRLTVDELLPGDLMRHQGIAREVTQISPSVVEWAIRVVFRAVPGRSRGLTVPLFVPVTVWRVADDG